ncbi:MAG TPA: lipocalin family protein [Steroidobacteraceae bacterium]|nr:lipocalin family protein [Steroidobacteraceae bacterium]
MDLIPIPTPHVDLDRYMGDWYVIESIPSRLEKNAWNQVESYSREPDGSIRTTFTYNKGAFEGPEKAIHARGFVKDEATNAVWGMQFVWPIRADYRIAWIADDYGSVLVAREKRDYLWIMARHPNLPQDELERLERKAAELGYDVAKIRRVPQEGRTQDGAPAPN